MTSSIREWLNLSVRWIHVFAAIMWVGQTYFFTWLDHTFHHERQVWMVHSGGFYIVDKQKVPEMLPKTLHWFKWEAYWTWISGFALLCLLYYVGANAYLIDRNVAEGRGGKVAFVPEDGEHQDHARAHSEHRLAEQQRRDETTDHEPSLRD